MFLRITRTARFSLDIIAMPVPAVLEHQFEVIAMLRLLPVVKAMHQLLVRFERVGDGLEAGK